MTIRESRIENDLNIEMRKSSCRQVQRAMFFLDAAKKDVIDLQEEFDAAREGHNLWMAEYLDPDCGDRVKSFGAAAKERAAPHAAPRSALPRSAAVQPRDEPLGPAPPGMSAPMRPPARRRGAPPHSTPAERETQTGAPVATTRAWRPTQRSGSLRAGVVAQSQTGLGAARW